MKFSDRIHNETFKETAKLKTLQVNLGKICNLACQHCHVEAGPKRTETMSLEVMKTILEVLKKHSFSTLDITGGAPEMHEHFEWFVSEASHIVEHIIVRTNLVILQEKPYTHLTHFYAQHRINLVASLPCYTQDNVDKMRGRGVYEDSIAVIKRLNSLGYGSDAHLVLDFVYNPGGAFLPGNQQGLEADYKRVLKQSEGIVFNHLFTITNAPIGRFYASLKQNNEHERYQTLLESHFNAATLENMMCRSQISVGYDGQLYDCDFNQMLGLNIQGARYIDELLHEDEHKRPIVFGEHCYACTAGAGSSCCGVTLS